MRRAATSHRTVAAENVVVTSGSCKNCREISDDGAKGSGAAGPETREYAGEIAKSIVLTRLCHPVLLAARTCHHRPPRQTRKDHRREQNSFRHSGECRHSATSLPVGYTDQQPARRLRRFALHRQRRTTPVSQQAARRYLPTRGAREARPSDLKGLGIAAPFGCSDAFECEAACVT